MPRLKPEKLKELEKYTKAEIIEAIGRNYTAGYIVEELLLDLKTIQMQKNLSDEREADRIKTEKLEALLLIEDVLDTLVEVGNGVTDEMLHEAADKLFKARGLLEGGQHNE